MTMSTPHEDGFSMPSELAVRLSREDYARRFGPTTGDLIRLADTNLWVRVEDDDVGYGDEPVWGYAKNFRFRQAQFDRAAPDSELCLAGTEVLRIPPHRLIAVADVVVLDPDPQIGVRQADEIPCRGAETPRVVLT